MSKPKRMPQADRLTLYVHYSTLCYKLSRIIVICATIFACVYCGYMSVREAAGKETNFSMVQKWILDAGVHVYIGWGVGAAATGVAYWERRKRLIERAEKDIRIAALEKAIDPKRESTNMSVEGEAE